MVLSFCMEQEISNISMLLKPLSLSMCIVSSLAFGMCEANSPDSQHCMIYFLQRKKVVKGLHDATVIPGRHQEATNRNGGRELPVKSLNIRTSAP